MPFIFEIDYCDGGKSEWLLLFLGRNYRIADGSVHLIDEQAAWCEKCQRLVAAEHLQSLPDLERELAELKSGSGQMCDWLRALDIPVEREIAELEHKLVWRRQRASSARCLECGSEAIAPIPSEGGTVHPGNGKRIRVRCQDRCQSVHLNTHYSTEGVRIAETVTETDQPRDCRCASSKLNE